MCRKRHLFFSISIAVYFLPVLLSAAESENSCIGLKSCASCTQNPECAWCLQSDFHGQDKKPQNRCNTLINHRNNPFRCETSKLFLHSNKLVVVRNDSVSNAKGATNSVPIQPQQISLKLRVNDPVSFNLKYREVEDYPLELYYLMDGTYSMRDDKDVLEGLGDSIGERLRTLTSKYRQGFGTFVDKVTMPFATRIPVLAENPCYTEDDVCIPSYGFKNHMPLNNNTRGFTDAVKAFQLSASSDFAEGGLDALMQVMVCEKAIGWSKQGRRLIIFATDGTFHFAGDGRLGGIILPNDGECHLDSSGKYYTHSLITDYPSMAQINLKAQEKNINIIFAVTSEIIDEYKTLASVIEGSTTTELAKNSSNIVDIVEDQYKKIAAKVEIKDNFPSEYFKVKYYSRCQDVGGMERETSLCDNLLPGIVVDFRVEIELIKCPDRKEEWKRQYRINPLGFPDSIELDVETLCDCPCEELGNGIPNSPLCNRKGTENCGLCKCNQDHFGEFCECSINNSTRMDDSNVCKMENSTETCSGRGNCICRQCVCSEKRYTGNFCECDNQNCLITNGQLCSGHGTCNCGNCVCNPGWEGSACDCSTDQSTCFVSGSTEECGGRGKCVCGGCQCQKEYGGRNCEICRVESCKRCEELKHCVQCKLYNTGIYNPADCELNCFKHKITTVDVISDAADISEIFCRAEDHTDGCTFIFSYKSKGHDKVQIKAQEIKECPPEAPIYWILGSVSGLVVVIGIILLCVFRGIRKYKIKREYAAYKRERDNQVWENQINPIYNDPIGKFENPMYIGKSQNTSKRNTSGS